MTALTARYSFTSEHRGGSGAPLVLIHGFTDTWRSWELVLPALERAHDVLAPTLPGHTGGPEIGTISLSSMADGVERAMDGAGWETAHLAGNSLGGQVALQLAERGRARSVVALAPAGGWDPAGPMKSAAMSHFRKMRELLAGAAPNAEQIVSSAEGRRSASRYVATNWEHLPAELLAHQMVGAAACPAADALIDFAERSTWELDAERVGCPVRIVWGTRDLVLPLGPASVRYREWLPSADWIELDDVGHCPQLDVPAQAAELIGGLSR